MKTLPGTRYMTIARLCWLYLSLNVSNPLSLTGHVFLCSLFKGGILCRMGNSLGVWALRFSPLAVATEFVAREQPQSEVQVLVLLGSLSCIVWDWNRPNFVLIAEMASGAESRQPLWLQVPYGCCSQIQNNSCLLPQTSTRPSGFPVSWSHKTHYILFFREVEVSSF